MTPRPRAIDWHRIGRESLHVLQRWILETIAEGGNAAQSPVQLQRALEELGIDGPIWPIPRINQVAAHVVTLRDAGRLEMRRQETRRGAVEHFYGVTDGYLMSGQREAEQRLQALTRLPGEDPAEKLARWFHETYERLAPAHGYKTREESAVPWEQVPATNKRLMIDVCSEIIDSCEIEVDIARVSGVGDGA